MLARGGRLLAGLFSIKEPSSLPDERMTGHAPGSGCHYLWQCHRPDLIEAEIVEPVSTLNISFTQLISMHAIIPCIGCIPYLEYPEEYCTMCSNICNSEVLKLVRTI